MARLEDPTPAAQAAFSLDIRPLPRPVNPFAWYAGLLRAADYHPEELPRARELVTWFEYLARSIPDLVTADPVLAVAACRAGVSGQDRAFLVRACEGLAPVIRASVAPSGPAPGDPGSTGTPS